jgi:hypothetical protein
MAKRLKNKPVETGKSNAKTQVTPAEKLLNLAAMIQFGFDQRNIGCYYLEKVRGQKNIVRFVFGFECAGIHPSLRPEQLEPIFDSIEAGLKDLPRDESLTFHFGTFRNDLSRQAEFKNLITTTPDTELQFFLLGESDRVEELSHAGIRKPNFLRLYVTYTVYPQSHGSRGWLERVTQWLILKWEVFKGEFEEFSRQQVTELFKQAYHEGFCQWEHLLSTKMGLTVQALTVEELWQYAWERFNADEAIAIPHQITIDEQGIREQITAEHDIRTQLMRQVPTTRGYRDCLRFPAKRKPGRDWVAGVLTYNEKPAGWVDKTHQLRAIWEVFARDEVFDTEVFCELSPANPDLVQMQMQRNLKQSNVTSQLAEQHNSIDVAARIKLERSVEAQADLYRGNVPIRTAVVFVVYRESHRKLQSACRFLSNTFHRPAWVGRETEYAWKIWFETLPFSWNALLASPFNRRHVYLSSEVIGVLPLVRPKPVDQCGLELITREGGTPLYLDIKKLRHIGVFGTSRGGKSVLLSGLMNQALSEGLPVLGLDYPRADGTSTFTDYVHFMGDKAAYFDIRKQSNNLFELPDLRGFNAQIQRERMEDYKSFLESALMQMVMGRTQGGDPFLNQGIRDILTLSLTAFFRDEAIAERYALAQDKGFGSPAWLNSPTLADFLTFINTAHLEVEDTKGDIQASSDRIKLRLRSWLNRSVGQAISQPSTIRSDAKLQVFALSNLNNDEDAAILALSAYGRAIKTALEHPNSYFMIDESPVLFEFTTIANIIGRLFANGLKAGIHAVLSAQDPDTIANSPAGAKIFQNMSTRLTGRLQPSAIPSFEKYLQYEREAIALNASDQYYPNKIGFYSNWLLEEEGFLTHTKYYPGLLLLAAVANNRAEQEARTQCMQNAQTKYHGLSQYRDHFIQMVRQSVA